MIFSSLSLSQRIPRQTSLGKLLSKVFLYQHCSPISKAVQKKPRVNRATIGKAAALIVGIKISRESGQECKKFGPALKTFGSRVIARKHTTPLLCTRSIVISGGAPARGCIRIYSQSCAKRAKKYIHVAGLYRGSGS